MDKKIITFGDIEIEKHKFHQRKKFNFLGRCRYKDVDIDDDHNLKSLRIMLPEEKLDGEIKWMYFFIENDELLETYNNIWSRVSNSIEKQLDFKPIDNKKFLKTKIGSHSNRLLPEGPKVGSNYTFLSVILLDSVLEKDKNYYLQVFLRKCKYTEKKTKNCLDILLMT